MARPLKPLVKSGGFYPSRKWTPLVYAGGYTTANGGGEPEPPPIEKTVTGNPIHITDALAKPVQALSVKIEPIQDLNGYDNPWPAGGGKNKLAFPYFEGSKKTNNGVTFTVNDDGTVRINGTATARSVFYLQADGSNFHPDAGTYYVSKGSESQSAAIIVEAYNGATWKKNLATVGTAVSVQFTVDYDGYDRVVAYISVASGNSPSNEIVKPMLRMSSVSDATFAPYSNICPISGWTGANIHVSPTTDAEDGTTYTITFPSSVGTVYGGTLDVTSGKLTVDRAMIDLGSIGWAKSSSTDGGFYTTNKFSYRWASDTKMLCSRYKFDGVRIVAPYFGDNGTLTCYFGSEQPIFEIYIKDESLGDKTASEFQSAMSGVQLVYELATPIEYDLTPTEITTLLGTNNLWSDGTMTLVYLADGNASDTEALNILLGGRYVNNHGEDEPTDREALDILLGGTR